MTRIITRAELARWAGVARSTATRAGVKVMGAAMVGENIDAEHPDVLAWLAGHDVYVLPPITQREVEQAAAPPKKKTSPPRKKSTGSGPTARNSAPARKKSDAAKPDGSGFSMPMSSVGGVPVEQLEDLSLKQIVVRHGGVAGFKNFVDSLKGVADYKFRDMRNKQQRGQLIDRDKVAGAVFPLVEVAFSRLVSDVPDTLSKMVIARVESGGPETFTDVQKLIRDANSRVLKNVKQTLLALPMLGEK